jgi:hypothetical protein
VLDQLCNHKQAITDWSTSIPATCCCKHWTPFKSAALNPSDPHWVLAGSRLPSLVFSTRSSRPRGNTTTSFDLVSSNGPSEMVCRPYRSRIFWP